MIEQKIVSSNGKVYQDLRAYHIALGHTVRQALIDFSKEIEQFCQNKVADFYGEHSPDFYDRTNQLFSKMKLGQLIKTEIKGAFEQERASFLIDIFDWEVLDASQNGDGMLGTYTDFYGDDSRESFEIFLGNGIYGHTEFKLRDWVKQYVNENLDKIIEKALSSM